MTLGKIYVALFKPKDFKNNVSKSRKEYMYVIKYYETHLLCSKLISNDVIMDKSSNS